jgi:hypothetical protein
MLNNKAKQNKPNNEGKEILSIVSVVIAILALIVAGLTYYDTTQPKETKLTVKTQYIDCFNPGIDCNQLFIYNNDDAPCFDFRLEFDSNEFEEVNLMKDYEKSRILDAEFNGNTISFPAMRKIPLKRNNESHQGWLGFIKNKEAIYITFIPKNKSKEHKVKVICVGYEKEIMLDKARTYL